MSMQGRFGLTTMPVAHCTVNSPLPLPLLASPRLTSPCLPLSPLPRLAFPRLAWLWSSQEQFISVNREGDPELTKDYPLTGDSEPCVMLSHIDQ